MTKNSICCKAAHTECLFPFMLEMKKAHIQLQTQIISENEIFSKPIQCRLNELLLYKWTSSAESAFRTLRLRYVHLDYCQESEPAVTADWRRCSQTWLTTDYSEEKNVQQKKEKSLRSGQRLHTLSRKWFMSDEVHLSRSLDPVAAVNSRRTTAVGRSRRRDVYPLVT